MYSWKDCGCREQPAPQAEGSWTAKRVFHGPLKPWTICELNQLRNLTDKYGFSADFIAHLQLVPGRSKDSVSGMMHRNGLGNVAVRERAKQAHHLTEREREKLTLFLRGEGRLMPSSIIAEKWGIAQKTVNGYRRRLGVTLSWQEARSSQEYQGKRERLARRFVRQMRERWRKWREQRRQTLENLRQELELLPSPPATRVCQVCQEQWFATREFYYVQTRKRGTRENIAMSRTCRLCRSDQRRYVTRGK